MQTPDFDRFVLTCVAHFVSIFEKELLERAFERAERNLADSYGYTAQGVHAKLAELDEDAAASQAALSPLYAMVRAPCSASTLADTDALHRNAHRGSSRICTPQSTGV